MALRPMAITASCLQTWAGRGTNAMRSGTADAVRMVAWWAAAPANAARGRAEQAARNGAMKRETQGPSGEPAV